MQKVATMIIRPPFKREGRCKRRGHCCHYILMTYSPSLTGRFFYLWYTEILGFYRRLLDPQDYEGKKMYVLGCRHLRKDGTCGDYRLRPLICRQWPIVDYFGYPKILKGCGYHSNPPYPSKTIDRLSKKMETTRTDREKAYPCRQSKRLILFYIHNLFAITFQRFFEKNTDLDPKKSE